MQLAKDLIAAETKLMAAGRFDLIANLRQSMERALRKVEQQVGDTSKSSEADQAQFVKDSVPEWMVYVAEVTGISLEEIAFGFGFDIRKCVIRTPHSSLCADVRRKIANSAKWNKLLVEKLFEFDGVDKLTGVRLYNRFYGLSKVSEACRSISASFNLARNYLAKKFFNFSQPEGATREEDEVTLQNRLLNGDFKTEKAFVRYFQSLSTAVRAALDLEYLTLWYSAQGDCVWYAL